MRKTLAALGPVLASAFCVAAIMYPLGMAIPLTLFINQFIRLTYHVSGPSPADGIFIRLTNPLTPTPMTPPPTHVSVRPGPSPADG